MSIRKLIYLSGSHILKPDFRRCYHSIPFIDVYQRTTGQSISEGTLSNLKKKHPNIDKLSHDRLQCTLQILNKYGITAMEACQNIHVFCMNPITMDNYGEILKECGFIHILPKYIIKYHTLVRSRTIARLKKDGLMREDIKLEQVLLNYFQDWPADHKSLQCFTESTTSILTVRMSVLQQYLKWRLSITSDDFNKYCRNYLPLKHKPMCNIQEALDIAENDIKFDVDGIRRNGFIISSDPVNTKLIIENVGSLAGLDIREALRIEPAILKNNYNALLQIRDVLEEYRIPVDAQRRCLRVYCMCPETVKERLEELRGLKEYQVLSTNPRALSMVVHQKKLMNRLTKIQAAKKQCYSLNHLISSSKVFNNYISSFGNKVCGRDIAILISSSLRVSSDSDVTNDVSKSQSVRTVLKQLRRHKYWLHSALNVIDGNIRFLKQRFGDEIIFNNCQLLLYPISDVEYYVNLFLSTRDSKLGTHGRAQRDAQYNSLDHAALTDNQILSLVLYEIEKKYHFSGDGIWTKQDAVKTDSQSAN